MNPMAPLLIFIACLAMPAWAETPCADACSGAESLAPAPLKADPAKKAKWAGLHEEELVSADALRKKMLAGEKFLILDARTQKSYNELHIRGAKLPLSKSYYKKEDEFTKGAIRKLPDTDPALRQGMTRYPKNTPIVTYCNDNCQASAVLLFKLKSLGFSNVKAMEDGIQTWQRKGYPVATEAKIGKS